MGRSISAEILLPPEKTVLTALVADLGTGFKTKKVRLLTAGGLRIKGGSASATVQAHTAIYASTQNATTGALTLVTKALDTDMAALAGTVTNAKYNVFCFFIDSAGTLTSAMGTEGATLAAVVLPTFDPNKACIGMLIVNPTGTGNFVGATTVLDDATVVPNAVFIDTLGGWNPTITQSISA